VVETVLDKGGRAMIILPPSQRDVEESTTRRAWEAMVEEVGKPGKRAMYYTVSSMQGNYHMFVEVARKKV